MKPVAAKSSHGYSSCPVLLLPVTLQTGPEGLDTLWLSLTRPKAALP